MAHHLVYAALLLLGGICHCEDVSSSTESSNTISTLSNDWIPLSSLNTSRSQSSGAVDDVSAEYRRSRHLIDTSTKASKRKGLFVKDTESVKKDLNRQVITFAKNGGGSSSSMKDPIANFKDISAYDLEIQLSKKRAAQVADSAFWGNRENVTVPGEDTWDDPEEAALREEAKEIYVEEHEDLARTPPPSTRREGVEDWGDDGDSLKTGIRIALLTKQTEAPPKTSSSGSDPFVSRDGWVPIEKSVIDERMTNFRQARKFNWKDGDDYEEIDIITAPPDAQDGIYSFVVGSSFGKTVKNGGGGGPVKMVRKDHGAFPVRGELRNDDPAYEDIDIITAPPGKNPDWIPTQTTIKEKPIAVTRIVISDGAAVSVTASMTTPRTTASTTTQTTTPIRTTTTAATTTTTRPTTTTTTPPTTTTTTSTPPPTTATAATTRRTTTSTTPTPPTTRSTTISGRHALRFELPDNENPLMFPLHMLSSTQRIVEMRDRFMHHFPMFFKNLSRTVDPNLLPTAQTFSTRSGSTITAADLQDSAVASNRRHSLHVVPSRIPPLTTWDEPFTNASPRPTDEIIHVSTLRTSTRSPLRKNRTQVRTSTSSPSKKTSFTSSEVDSDVVRFESSRRRQQSSRKNTKIDRDDVEEKAPSTSSPSVVVISRGTTGSTPRSVTSIKPRMSFRPEVDEVVVTSSSSSTSMSSSSSVVSTMSTSSEPPKPTSEASTVVDYSKEEPGSSPQEPEESYRSAIYTNSPEPTNSSLSQPVNESTPVEVVYLTTESTPAPTTSPTINVFRPNTVIVTASVRTSVAPRTTSTTSPKTPVRTNKMISNAFELGNANRNGRNFDTINQSPAPTSAKTSASSKPNEPNTIVYTFNPFKEPHTEFSGFPYEVTSVSSVSVVDLSREKSTVKTNKDNFADYMGDAPIRFNEISESSKSLDSSRSKGPNTTAATDSEERLSYILIISAAVISVLSLMAVVIALRWRQVKHRRRALQQLQESRDLTMSWLEKAYTYSQSNSNLSVGSEEKTNSPLNGVLSSPRGVSPSSRPSFWFMGKKRSPYAFGDSYRDSHPAYRHHGLHTMPEMSEVAPGRASSMDSTTPLNITASIPSSLSPTRHFYSSILSSDTRHASGLESVSKGEMIYWSSNNEQLI